MRDDEDLKPTLWMIAFLLTILVGISGYATWLLQRWVERMLPGG